MLNHRSKGTVCELNGALNDIVPSQANGSGLMNGADSAVLSLVKVMRGCGEGRQEEWLRH